MPQPVPVAPRPAPAITGISPSTGSTGGDTTIAITGTGFYGATVTLDGITQRAARFHPQDPNTAYLETSAHAAGSVDVVVTNLAGQISRLTAGYTYASPQSFDFNGNWWTELDSHMILRFTIQNNLLVSVSCSPWSLALSPPLSIANGEFSFPANQGFRMSGRIVSASEATGTIDIAQCPSSIGWVWRAERIPAFTFSGPFPAS